MGSPKNVSFKTNGTDCADGQPLRRSFSTGKIGGSSAREILLQQDSLPASTVTSSARGPGEAKASGLVREESDEHSTTQSFVQDGMNGFQRQEVARRTDALRAPPVSVSLG